MGWLFPYCLRLSSATRHFYSCLWQYCADLSKEYLPIEQTSRSSMVSAWSGGCLQMEQSLVDGSKQSWQLSTPSIVTATSHQLARTRSLTRRQWVVDISKLSKVVRHLFRKNCDWLKISHCKPLESEAQDVNQLRRGKGLVSIPTARKCRS